MRGVLMDARPLKGGGLELALATREGLQWTRLPGARFRAYLLPRPSVEPRRIAWGALEGCPDCGVWVEEWLAPPYYDSKATLVIVEHERLDVVRAVASSAERAGLARRVNDYPGSLEEALWRLGLTPGIPVEASAGGARPLEDPWDPFYDPPQLRAAVVRGVAWYGEAVSPGEVERFEVHCCGERVVARDPGELAGVLSDMKPHVVVAGPAVLPLVPRGGYLVAEQPGVGVGVWGVLEWCRVSGLTFPRASSATIGEVLTSAEALEAMRRRMIVDRSAARLEAWRPLASLRASDRAGLVRTPEPGVYWNVYQVDFNSLYPTIIARFNLSGETVEAPGCSRRAQPPGAPHWVCMDRRGVVAEVLGRLVERRARLKEAINKAPGGLAGILRERAEALKWILVSGFGYLGYRNSIFGSIQAYENVTALARLILLKAERTAERLGYRVVHSIVDSAFIQPAGGDPAPIEEVMEAIHRATGIPVKLEAAFHWLYIPPTLRGVGAANKYYGPLRGGGFKAKGVLAVRADAPPIAREAQIGAFKALAGARDPQALFRASLEAASVVEAAVDRVFSGDVPPEKLVVRRRRTLKTPGSRLAPRASRLEAYIKVRGGLWPTIKGPPPRELVDWGYYARRVRAVLRELPTSMRPRAREHPRSHGDGPEVAVDLTLWMG
jgi:DNA polymerase I